MRPKYLLLIKVWLSSIKGYVVFGMDFRGIVDPQKFQARRLQQYNKITKALDKTLDQIEKLELHNAPEIKVEAVKRKHYELLDEYLVWLSNNGLYEELVEWENSIKV